MKQNKTKKFTKNRSLNSSYSTQPNQNLIYGKHPVLSAILYRKRTIHKLFITKNSQSDFQKFITDNNIKFNDNLIKLVDNNYLNNLLFDATHQGFALEASPINPISQDQFLNKAKNLEKEDLPPILILDQLTDPHNIGAIIRSAAAFNVKYIAFTQRNFPTSSGIISKSSSGMIELVDFISVNNLNNFIKELKNLKYWSVGLDGEATMNIHQIKSYQPIALVLGSEGGGIRRLVKSNCDLLVKIATNSKVESLNVSNAAAISLYELFSKG
jgi:23S rRNA (guanosine2251-2'-O)-methyltransferase